MMKGKKVWALLIILFLFVTTTGCKTVSSPQVEKPVEEVKPVVYASIYPLYDFAGKIGQDKIDLRLIIPPGAEPHDWEPTAKMMVELEKADVLIYNGAELEIWIDKVMGSLSNDKLIILEAVEGIELIKFKDHGHADDPGHEEEDDHHGEYDPHVWLDPTRAMQQAESIKNTLIRADEKNKDFYESNYIEIAEKLTALDRKYEESLKNRKRNEIVVAHGAFGYMAERYGLEQISILGLSPQEEPSPAKLAALAKEVKGHDVQYIFFETLTSSRLSQVLANETGAKTAVLNPLDGLTAEEMNAGLDYFSVMEENLAALVRALGE